MQQSLLHVAAVVVIAVFCSIVSTSHTNKFNKHEELNESWNWTFSLSSCLPLLPLPSHWPCNWCVNPHIDSGYCGGFCWKYAPGRASRASRARQSYSQWRICCRDSLMLRVYGLLKGFAHCILSSLGHRLSNLITLRHWNYCNMLYCRQHSLCVRVSVCVSDFIGPMRVCWLARHACVCVYVCGSKSPTAHSTR